MYIHDACCRYAFKLADFGTARKLEPDQKFTSLHGTEEYLVKTTSTLNLMLQNQSITLLATLHNQCLLLKLSLSVPSII